MTSARSAQMPPLPAPDPRLGKGGLFKSIGSGNCGPGRCHHSLTHIPSFGNILGILGIIPQSLTGPVDKPVGATRGDPLPGYNGLDTRTSADHVELEEDQAGRSKYPSFAPVLEARLC